jgi:hypothetical protein
MNVNYEIGIFFQTNKDLHQREPLSPLLFNIILGMLTILINRGKEDEQLSRVVQYILKLFMKKNI